jgi:hypothetical protein
MKASRSAVSLSSDALSWVQQEEEGQDGQKASKESEETSKEKGRAQQGSGHCPSSGH